MRADELLGELSSLRTREACESREQQVDVPKKLRPASLRRPTKARDPPCYSIASSRVRRAAISAYKPRPESNVASTARGSSAHATLQLRAAASRRGCDVHAPCDAREKTEVPPTGGFRRTERYVISATTRSRNRKTVHGDFVLRWIHTEQTRDVRNANTRMRIAYECVRMTRSRLRCRAGSCAVTPFRIGSRGLVGHDS